MSMPSTPFHGGDSNPIRILWAKRLHRPIIVTAKTAIDCDDIVVLALYSQLARRSPARRHNAATLSVHPDVPLDFAPTSVHSMNEERKQSGTEIRLNRAFLRRQPCFSLRCFDAYCILQAPWSVVSLDILQMGPKQTRGFGITASVPLPAKEYIYELAGLILVDGNAEHTRLSQYEATTIQLIGYYSRMQIRRVRRTGTIRTFLQWPSQSSLVKMKTLKGTRFGWSNKPLPPLPFPLPTNTQFPTDIDGDFETLSAPAVKEEELMWNAAGAARLRRANDYYG
ncbi:hypothetical protein B0H14DRAFT_2641058 [Mycena olivaceomarginata]|nr:hypothetical protein B0H14DRAFT_2641058 [Mycena olivaceomarginata]